MNLWKTNLTGSDIERGDVVLFVTKEMIVRSGSIESRYDYNDDFDCYYIRTADYEDFESSDIICWAYLNDFLRTVPPEILRSGLTADVIQSDHCTLGYVVHYTRFGSKETRLFYDQGSALKFYHDILVRNEAGCLLDFSVDKEESSAIEVLYLDKCYD